VVLGAETVRTVLVVDYDLQRRAFVREMVESVFPDSRITEDKASPRDQNEDINVARADELAKKASDLVLYNTMSNPPPKLFIEKFKKNFPKSRVLLYTDLTTFSVEDFNEYRHADGMMSVLKGDSTDPERISIIKKTIDLCSKVSPSTTLEWLDRSTQVLKKVSKLTAALAVLVGIVIGALVSNYDQLSVLMSKMVQ
jgi:hypothetical protein